MKSGMVGLVAGLVLAYNALRLVWPVLALVLLQILVAQYLYGRSVVLDLLKNMLIEQVRQYQRLVEHLLPGHL